jgi:alkanesulfonate monooxygenase SsuD/methylene tetrahydromethanopterin reductase-like flavin-dependent oxidoreductase (luciferase family)
MRFSMIFEAQIADPSRGSERRIFHELVEQALLAEEMDFDCIWAVEHHCLVRYAHMSAPETFLAYLAGATKRIELGHGVVCLPHAMNHPIKVAERIATLDILSRGRLHFGVGKGGTQQEAGAFGQQLEALQPQIDEAMAMIPRMWRDADFSFESERIRIPPRPIHPKPWQDPHPPMYLACTREATLNMAGERGMGALVLGFGGPDDIARKNQVYRAAFARRRPEDQVGEFATEHLAALCPAIVLDDGARARRIGLRGQRFFSESLAHWYNNGPEPSTAELGEEELRQVMEEGKQRVLAYLGEERIPLGTEVTGLYNPNHAYGTVEDAKAYVQRLVDAGADEILFLMQMGTVPQEAILDSIRNVGERVIPHFRKRYGRGLVRRHEPTQEPRAARS